MGSYRFSKVILENWRNFPSVDVEMEERVFIVGRNAIGKTNFIDVFRFLRDLAMFGGGLAMAVYNRKGMTNIRSRFARRMTNVELSIKVEDESGKGWEYSISFDDSNKPDPRAPDGRGIKVVHERLAKIGGSKVKESFGAARSLLESEKETEDFKDFVEFLVKTTYLHLVPQMIRENQTPLSETIGADPFGRGLLDQILKAAPADRKKRLKIIGKILERINPQFRELAQTVDSAGRPHLEVLFKDWRHHNSRQDERQFSDGMLRLIGLLWVVQDAAGTVLLEEPELSLNSGIAGQIAPFLSEASRLSGGRQVIVATHSEALMADEGIRPEEILLVQPAKKEGSTIVTGADIPAVNRQLRAGMLPSQVVLPIVYGLPEFPVLTVSDKSR